MPTRSGRLALFALTAGLWAAYWAASNAMSAFAGAQGGYLFWLMASRTLACVLGALVCLGIGRILDRWTTSRPVYTVLQAILLGDLAAIAWAMAVRMALFPSTRLLALKLGLSTDDFRATTSPVHDPIPLVAWIFIAWIGARHAVRLAVAREATPSYVDELWAGGGKGLSLVAVRDVTWIEAERDYARLHVPGRSGLMLREPMHALSKRLNPATFVRVRRSAIVNLAHVDQIAPRAPKGLDVLMKSGDRVPVGRSYVGAVRNLMAGRTRSGS